ncbi:SusC/RagA family TonB-linked outer membrane protein [Runella sp. MFBS21]|uniref:SusC/RagA family TonB-linked outer membrane protein n=1 Tax=Runella sp. MFBS21 TaxID=3034018 RepID=UPI0023F83A25|nr:SusC/RagA family TonB-linked outer membrane protein [Runella sp. MFBS21]MDF7816339.1 SusC/RagA family TonB-linked outer membrane protein [Runella sp. MFBS21]
MRKSLFLSFLLACVSWISLQAQERKVTGKITSAEDGTPLPGVSVVVKGTTKGTNTDADGNYSIMATNSSTLVFSFVGTLTQEIGVGSRSAIDVKLASDTKQLTEVVVTAIGIQREKKGLGYAVTNVGGESLQQRSEPDPLRALSAKVPGVTIVGGGGAPGQATKINIRGFNSLTGSTQPLFVVDGIPFDNSVSAGGAGSFANNTGASNRAYDIDPNNIESMTVLKGAAAAALYGSRAVNGVILITTKAGSKKARKGLEVSYNMSYNTEKISSLPEYQDAYTQGSNQNYSGTFIGNWGPPMPNYVDKVNQQYYDGQPRYTKTYSTYRYGPNAGKPYPDGFAEHQLNLNQNLCAMYPELCDQYGNGIAEPVMAHDVVGGFFKTGQLWENGINISSTGDKTSLNATISRMTNEGIVPSQKSSRTNLSFGGNATLANGLTVSGNVNYVNTTTANPPLGAGYYTDYGGFSNEGSIFGRLYYLPRNYNLNGYPFEDPRNGANLFYRSGLDNPLWSIKYNKGTSEVNRAFGNLALSYDVTPWFNILLKGGINTYSDRRVRSTAKGGTAQPLGFIRNQDVGFMEQDYNLIMSVNREFGENISFRALAGGNLNQRFNRSQTISAVDIISRGLDRASATASQIVTEDFTSLRRLYGVYADVLVGYKNMVFLGLTGRNDWSSTLPADNRSYFYPAATLSFNFTDAFQMPSFVDNGKLRIGYGKVGSDTDPYRLQTVYPLGVAYRNYAGQTFYRASLSDRANNATLRPEFKSELEVGLELSFLKSRISADITWFNSDAKDQIIAQRVAASSGFTEQIVNAGWINNKGWEISLNLVPVRLANGFEWSSSFAFTRIRSLVKDAGPQGSIFLGGTGTSALGTIHKTGYPYGQIFGTKNARDKDGNLLINELDGLPYALPTSQIIGNPNPNFTLGWTNTFSWKGINLGILLDYRDGGQMWSSTAASLLLRGMLKFQEDREALRVVPGVYGDNTKFTTDPATGQTYGTPVLGDDGKPLVNTTGITAFDWHFSRGFGAYGQDEVNVYDITTIRIREISLGYTIPKKWLTKTPFGSARVSASGRNLWFRSPNLLKGLGFDPEVLGSFPDSNIQGFDLGAQPSTRRFGVNLNLTF